MSENLVNLVVPHFVGSALGRSHWSETQWGGLQVSRHAKIMDGRWSDSVLHQGFLDCVYDAGLVQSDC